MTSDEFHEVIIDNTSPDDMDYYENDALSYYQPSQSECSSSSTIIEEPTPIIFPKPSYPVMWHKKEYTYTLDQSYNDKIMSTFETKMKCIKDKKFYNRDIKMDAFYSGYESIPLMDLEVLLNDKRYNERIECINLRCINMELIKYTKLFTLQAETLISAFNSQEWDENITAVMRASIRKKKRIAKLYNIVRNYLSMYILAGEECKMHMFKASRIASIDLNSCEN